ncbi:MAG: HAD family hydrolase [Eubacterium sp.]|nr:HAD family hydrolase [Eubacterium sp.]
MYQTILFDLDGTLTDPGIGITNSVMYALEKFGIQVSDRSTLYPFIGPPLQDSFETFYGFSKADAEIAVTYYREYYRDQGIYENKLYDGISELLQMLCDAGRKLLVATSKPEEFAVRILEHFQISGYFTYIAGADMNGPRTQKADVISYALASGRVAERSSAVMVGDRAYDIVGAKQNGIDSIGVLFGYGSRQELVQAGADHIAEQPYDIGQLVLRHESVH